MKKRIGTSRQTTLPSSGVGLNFHFQSVSVAERSSRA